MNNDFTAMQERMATVDPSLILGRLCWYTVREVQILHEDLVKLLAQVGLTAFLPNVPSDSDAFRRVISDSERKKVPTGDANVYDNYLVRRISKGSNLVARIVRERVDANSNEIMFEASLCLLEFERATASVKVTCEGDDTMAHTMASDIVARYAKERGTLNSWAVRDLIRHVLVASNATTVRASGGIYFVPEGQAPRIDAIEALAELLGEAVIIHSLPLLDDSKQRAMLRRAFENESIDEIDRMIGEIADLKATGKKLSAERIGSYMDRWTALQGKAKDYTDLLEDNLEMTSGRLRIFRNQVMGLMAG